MATPTSIAISGGMSTGSRIDLVVTPFPDCDRFFISLHHDDSKEYIFLFEARFKYFESVRKVILNETKEGKWQKAQIIDDFPFNFNQSTKVSIVAKADGFQTFVDDKLHSFFKSKDVTKADRLIIEHQVAVSELEIQQQN